MNILQVYDETQKLEKSVEKYVDKHGCVFESIRSEKKLMENQRKLEELFFNQELFLPMKDLINYAATKKLSLLLVYKEGSEYKEYNLRMPGYKINIDKKTGYLTATYKCKDLSLKLSYNTETDLYEEIRNGETINTYNFIGFYNVYVDDKPVYETQEETLMRKYMENLREESAELKVGNDVKILSQDRMGNIEKINYELNTADVKVYPTKEDPNAGIEKFNLNELQYIEGDTYRTFPYVAYTNSHCKTPIEFQEQKLDFILHHVFTSVTKPNDWLKIYYREFDENGKAHKKLLYSTYIDEKGNVHTENTGYFNYDFDGKIKEWTH